MVEYSFVDELLIDDHHTEHQSPTASAHTLELRVRDRTSPSSLGLRCPGRVEDQGIQYFLKGAPQQGTSQHEGYVCVIDVQDDIVVVVNGQ
jgi:hypothetical protein